MFKTAIVVTDQQHSDHMKRLNSLKHETAVKQKMLEELQTRYSQMIKDAEEAVKTDAGESDTAAVRYYYFKKLKIHNLFLIYCMNRNYVCSRIV